MEAFGGTNGRDAPGSTAVTFARWDLGLKNRQPVSWVGRGRQPGCAKLKDEPLRRGTSSESTQRESQLLDSRVTLIQNNLCYDIHFSLEEHQRRLSGVIRQGINIKTCWIKPR